MSKSHCRKQRDQQQQIAALAKQSHGRTSDTATLCRSQHQAGWVMNRVLDFAGAKRWQSPRRN
jgi:hypothetical protein